jgi:16S rRNA (adenine1518-N6/adenine1519-N6)-dimethyltransferase
MNQPRPNKQLGQHWLHDETALQAMCQAADIQSDDTIVEVGPGLGTLTAYLVQKAKRVIAIEYDAHLANTLPERLLAANLTVHHGDILRFDLSTLPPGYKVVANVPYYITSKITRLFLESKHRPTTMTLLVQKEVAERMAAQPGSMSILAVAVQFFAEIRLSEIVPAELFTPPPKVDSQIITLHVREQPLFNNCDDKQLFRIVRAGFSEKRKKLRNALSGGLHKPKEEIEQLLQNAGISQDARAEQLSLENWYQLSKLIK